MKRFFGLRGDEGAFQIVWQLRLGRVKAVIAFGLPLSLGVGWRLGRRAAYVLLDLFLLSFGIFYRRAAPRGTP